MDEHETLDAPEPEPQGSPAPELEPPLPTPVDGEDHPVDARSVRLARWIAVPITTFLVSMPPFWLTLGWALGGVPSRVYLPLILLFALLAGTAIPLAYRFPTARYRHLSYRVDPDGLGIQRGVLWRTTIWIPMTRVQHTDVSQGPLQRRYDLAKLTVYTAGTEGASISLSGLEHGVASRLADHLRPTGAPRGG